MQVMEIPKLPHISHIAESPRFVFTLLRDQLEEEILVVPEPPVALCQRPEVVSIIKPLLEARGGNNLPAPAVLGYRPSERRVYVCFTRHDKSSADKYCMDKQKYRSVLLIKAERWSDL